MTRSYWLFGARFTVHANHEDTGGRYDLIEGNAPLATRRRCTGIPTLSVYSSLMAKWKLGWKVRRTDQRAWVRET